jgi:NADH-quinone oxidoreductase subunit G
MLPAKLNVKREDLIVVSIMPCTAKKFEAQRPEFAEGGIRDVDFVLTTQELATMIEGAGIRFASLRPESLDLPLGFKTGAGVIFGNTGGVTEAVLRYAVEKVTGVTLDSFEFHAVRGEDGLREATLELNGQPLRIAIVHGLANAQRVAEQVKAGKSQYDLIEVMACPGGCIGGAGQPINRDSGAKKLRTKGLYEADKMLQLHKSQENHFVAELYKETLGEVGGHKAHHLLHTEYHSRRRISDEDMSLVTGKTTEPKLKINVCVGTNCIARGSQDLLHGLVRHVEAKGLTEQVDVRASFCFEQCNRGPTVTIGGKVMNRCNFNSVCQALDNALAGKLPVSQGDNGGCGNGCSCNGRH